MYGTRGGFTVNVIMMDVEFEIFKEEDGMELLDINTTAAWENVGETERSIHWLKEWTQYVMKMFTVVEYSTYTNRLWSVWFILLQLLWMPYLPPYMSLLYIHHVRYSLSASLIWHETTRCSLEPTCKLVRIQWWQTPQNLAHMNVLYYAHQKISRDLPYVSTFWQVRLWQSVLWQRWPYLTA